MYHRKVLLAITLVLVLMWLAGHAVAQGTIEAQPGVAAEVRTHTSITSTVYLPFIAKPAPTMPYVLTKIKLPTGSHPHGIALDADQQRAFVGNHGTNSLSVIDTKAMVVSQTILLSGAIGPNGVAYHAGLDRVYVANRDSNNVSIVDPTNRVWIANRTVGSSPDGVAVADDLVYVANFGSNSVSILNVQTNLVTSTLSIGVEPAMLTQLEDSGTVFLSSHGNGYLYFLQNGAYANSNFGIAAPYGLAIDQITHRLYIANRGASHTVTLLDVDPNLIMGTINVGQEPYVIGVNSRTGHVFASLGDRVNVYDRRNNALITSLPVGTGAEEGLAVDPEHGLIYVTSQDTDEITVIQDSATLDLAYVTYRLSANQQPQSDILVSDDAGHHVSQLTQATGDLELNAQPVFQPGGKRVAFVSSRDDVDHNWNVFTMDLMGHNQVDLTNDGGVEDTEPAWSPDGTRIAWRRDWSIWVMTADGSYKQQLTFSLTARTPQWSPDGQWISFVAFANGGHEDVFIVPAAGGTPINLTNNLAADLQPSWAADSHTIAFETNRHSVISGTSTITENWELYAVNISTTVQTRLTDSPGQDHAAAWSPDGSQIAFISDRNNAQYDFGLWVMGPDGTQQRRVTGPMDLIGPIAWSPDGRRVVVQGGLLENAEIWAIDVASGVVTRLTNNTVEDANPVWRPDTWK